MSTERSSLLSTRRHTHQYVRKKQDASISYHQHVYSDRERLRHQPPPDLLGDSDDTHMPVPTSKSGVNVARRSIMNSRRKNVDEDLIQIQESETQGSQLVLGAPVSASIRKLNARIHVRNRVGSSSGREQTAMGSFDEDDSENEHDNDSSYRKSVNDNMGGGNIVNETLIDLHNNQNGNNNMRAALQHPPIDDLSKDLSISNMGNGKDFFNGLPNRQKLDLSPRPIHMKSKRVLSDPLSPVISKAPGKTVLNSDATPDRAKRAISTLFGQSVVDDDKIYSRDVSNSLLDSVTDTAFPSTQGTRSEVYNMPSQEIGLQARSQNYTYCHTDQNSAIAASSPQGAISQNVDIDDPFSYYARSTMNHRRDAQNNKSSTSAAKTWFGKSLNYTTRTVMKVDPDTNSGNKGLIEDHQLLDNLHQRNIDGNKPFYTNFIDKFPGELKSHLNWLNCSLCLGYAFTSAASCVPISLIPTIAMDVLAARNNANGDDGNFDASLEADATLFASRVATYAILGTAFGKFINGPMGDIFGARRVACLYALMLSFSLTMLSWVHSSWGIICCCAAIEYYQSVQWPCITVILAAHYGNGTTCGLDAERASVVSPDASRNVGRYEKGIYIASLGSRFGALFASISTTMLLSYVQDSWRVIARLAAMGSFLGFVIFYSFVTDSPGKLHDPQNPIKDPWNDMTNNYNRRQRLHWGHTTNSHIIGNVRNFIKMFSMVLRRNIVPSLRSVLSNYTFWIVAVAHSGGYMVCSSVRILGTYLRDTSNGNISGDKAGVVTMFLSVGVLTGLAVGGNAFANLSSNAKARKKMVANLYIITVTMCYTLSFLALPFIRKAIRSSTAVALLQVTASFCMGAGVAVQVYCIPAIVSCTFGANKGLYTSYTDGVACIVSSIVWRIVGNAVEEGNPQGTGWFYGWAAVALLVILAGLLMVEFVEHYFCRGGSLGRLQNVNQFADLSSKHTTTDSTDSNRSFEHLAESGKRLWESRPSFLRPSVSFVRGGPEVESILSIGDDDDDDASTIVFEDITLPVDFSGIENDELSRNPGDIQEQLKDLLEFQGNDICVDCHAPYPRWVSIILPNRVALTHRGASKPLANEIGCVCCNECAGIHRKLGTHLVFVRSVDHDSFKVKELVALRRGGNRRVNAIYEALLKDRSVKPSPASIPSQRDRFISTKYEKKLWYKAPDTKAVDMSENLDDTPLTAIELVSNHASASVFAQQAPFDKKAHDEYISFVRDDTTVEIAPPVKNKAFNREHDEGHSISSDDSEDWHIESNEERGLDDLINL